MWLSYDQHPTHRQCIQMPEDICKGPYICEISVLKVLLDSFSKHHRKKIRENQCGQPAKMTSRAALGTLLVWTMFWAWVRFEFYHQFYTLERWWLFSVGIWFLPCYFNHVPLNFCSDENMEKASTPGIASCPFTFTIMKLNCSCGFSDIRCYKVFYKVMN